MIARTLVNRPEIRSAFSLIELIVVMAIIMIVSAIAIPRFGNSIDRYRLDAAAERVVADLAFARRHAQITSKSVAVQFKPSIEEYRLKNVADPDHSGEEYAVDVALELDAEIVSADFEGIDTIIFDGHGVPDRSGTIVLGGRAGSRIITVDPDSGKASVQ